MKTKKQTNKHKLFENNHVDRDGGENDNGPASNYSSTNSLSNNSSSSYLLPSFACKRRPPESGTNNDANKSVRPNLRMVKVVCDSPTSNANRRSGTSMRGISNGGDYGNERDEDSRSTERGMVSF